MKYSISMVTRILLWLFSCICIQGYAQPSTLKFGKELSSVHIASKSKKKSVPIEWVNVNTAPDTWSLLKKELICTGRPIGVMRSKYQYENFLLHVEWKHIEPGGNSGVFIWGDAVP